MAVAASTRRSPTAAGVPVLTRTGTVWPAPPALVAEMEKVYDVPSVSPAIVAVVPVMLAVPPPVTV